MGRRALIAITTIAMVVLPLASPAGAQPGQPAESSFIVVLAPGADVPATAAQLAGQHGGRAGHVFDDVLGGFQFVGPSAAAAGLARSPMVTAVVPDQQFSLVDVAGWGFFRVDADQSVNDPAGPYRGANTRVAVIDSGIDTDHPDLAANLDLANSYNCQAPGSPPEDDNGHGTHVSGIAAATFGPNGYGVVGVAPEASILALKAFDASGYADTSDIVCALNQVAAVTTADPMPTALNMSFAEAGTDSTCNDADTSDVLHEAICDVVEVGEGATPSVPIVPVAAAGNSDVNAANTVPAAFHDVITVSALADFDGKAGGLEGCVYVQALFNYECDDTIASFSNWGTAVDVMAPGVAIYSTLPGGHGSNSGTSMAAPHVTGVVAAVLGEHASLDTAGVRQLLVETGECPDGSVADDTSCAGQGTWKKTKNRSIFDPIATEADPDGVPEPLVNAARAAAAADAAGEPPQPPPTDAAPQVTIDFPAEGATVSGTVVITGTASDDQGLEPLEVTVGGASLTVVQSEDNWSASWDTTVFDNGNHTITATATDSIGQTTITTRSVTVSNQVASDTSMHVAALTKGSSVKGKNWTATANVQVQDSTGEPVDGVTVTVSFESPATASLAAKGGSPGPPGGGGGGDGGADAGELSCITAADGWCSVSTKASGDSVKFTVTHLSKAGWTYDSSANAVSLEILVTKPT